MSLLPGKKQSNSRRCEHGCYDFCPDGCFQTEFELAIAEFMKTKSPDTDENVMRILKYKQAEARQMTFELSQVLHEIELLEHRLSMIRKGKEVMIYPYQCEECGKEFSVSMSIKNYETTKVTSCPICKSRKVKRVYTSGVGIHYKDSGFTNQSRRR